MATPESERFEAAVRLHEVGLAMQRENLRRRHPEASEDALDRMLSDWLTNRPLDYSPA